MVKERKLISKILMVAVIWLVIGLTINSLPIVTAQKGIDTKLKNMIDEYAGQYYHDFWNVSLTQYKSWIALITLREAGYGRYAAQSQYGCGYSGDRFNHKNSSVGDKFRFSTGIGAFQLDRGGSQGDEHGQANENWGIMPTIEKINPNSSLLSTLRWHRDRFGNWPGAFLANFSQYSAWNAVRPGKDFESDWLLITGYTWAQCNVTKRDVNFAPPTVNDPFENSVKYIGKAYWYLWGGYFDTWLISARSWSGTVVTVYYYTYSADKGLEEWVWNETLIHRFERKYTLGQFPEDRVDMGPCPPNIAVAGTTDSSPALDPSKLQTGVGGTWAPFDKFVLWAPYIGLASAILVATAFYATRVKRKKDKR